MEKITVRLARPDDNVSIQQLIRSHPMPGAVSILLQKAPDYFAACGIRGHTRQTLVGFSAGQLCVMASRSIQQAYINGKKQDLGYLSDLRSDRQYRKQRPLGTLCEHLRQLYADTPAHLHIVTIMDDNAPAKAALTWKNVNPAIPRFVEWGKFYTYLLPLLWKGGLGQQRDVTRAKPHMLEDIVRFLNKEGRAKQFYPAYTTNWLRGLKDFDPEDFWVVWEQGRMVGVGAGWDQHNFKQTIVVQYHDKMRLLKRLLGSLLPKEGKEIRHACACFFATKDNNPKYFKKLLQALGREWRARGYRSLLLGLHENDTLNRAVRLVPRLSCSSRLYVAEYADEAAIKARLDQRTPYLELGTL